MKLLVKVKLKQKFINLLKNNFKTVNSPSEVSDPIQMVIFTLFM